MSSPTACAISLNLWYRMFAEEHYQRHVYSLTNNGTVWLLLLFTGYVSSYSKTKVFNLEINYFQWYSKNKFTNYRPINSHSIDYDHVYSLTNNVGLRGGCNKMADGKSFFIGGKLKWVQIPSVGLNLELIPVYTHTQTFYIINLMR
jgi:hypothetical protein